MLGRRRKGIFAFALSAPPKASPDGARVRRDRREEMMRKTARDRCGHRPRRNAERRPSLPGSCRERRIGAGGGVRRRCVRQVSGSPFPKQTSSGCATTSGGWSLGVPTSTPVFRGCLTRGSIPARTRSIPAAASPENTRNGSSKIQPANCCTFRSRARGERARVRRQHRQCRVSQMLDGTGESDDGKRLCRSLHRRRRHGIPGEQWMGGTVAPLDPATNRAMTYEAWRAYMAEFMERIPLSSAGRRNHSQRDLVLRLSGGRWRTRTSGVRSKRPAACSWSGARTTQGSQEGRDNGPCAAS